MDDLISRKVVIDEFSCCELTPDGGIDANYAIDFLEQLPSAQPTLYGYSIDHLALIADVMEKEGVSPEEAVRFFNDTQRIYQMLVDEIQKQVEEMVESCVT